MFGKLAARNVKRQIGSYLIYFITVSLTVALMFAVNNVICSPQLEAFAQASSVLRIGLAVATGFVSLIVAFVLGYATSFMLRLRKREFGMYLTLGMTRRNLLSVFTLETLIMGVAALAAGLLLGLFLYQGLMLLLTRLMDMAFTFAAYSVKGLLLTVALVAAVFALASLTAAAYLKKASVYHLLHSDRMAEKAVRHPMVWLAATLASLAVVGCCCLTFTASVKAAMSGGDGSSTAMLVSLTALAAALVAFHVGLARSLTALLLRCEKFCSRGVNTFVLRQLSGRLGANAAMAGALAFLLAFAVIGANFSFTQKLTVEKELDIVYPFDISLWRSPDQEPAVADEQAEAIISSYAAIRSKASYATYSTGSARLLRLAYPDREPTEGESDILLAESDFNRILALLGREPVALRGEFLILPRMAYGREVDFSRAALELNGRVYAFGGFYEGLPRISYDFQLAVVPDEAVAGLTPDAEYVIYDLADGKYDAAGLYEALSYDFGAEAGFPGHRRCDYLIREHGRMDFNANTAVLILGTLYVAVVFVCLAMAILALKNLSGLAEDKRRYAVLYRLGADKKTQCSALFRQIFCFFFLPFALPLLLSVPAGLICARIMRLSGYGDLAGQALACSAAIAAVMAALYLLYFTATYLLAKRAVVPRAG